MLYLAFYWLVCGISLHVSTEDETGFEEAHPYLAFFVCLLMGGLVIPVRVLNKLHG